MEKSRKILVSNIPQNVHSDYIELFFENTRKYAGGSVKKVQYHDNDPTAIVEFETSQAVDRVLQDKYVIMMGQEVRVEAYREKPQSTIEVRGPTSLVNSHNLEILQLYFESPRNNGGKVEEVSFDSLRSVAYLTFESDKVAKRVSDHMTHVLKGQKMLVKLRQNSSCHLKHANTVDETDCTVRVSGLKDVRSKEIVQFYFENKRHSGGGTIKAFVLHDSNDDVADVTFEDVKDAKAVVGRNHVINGISIEVSMVRPVYTDRFLVEGLQDDTTEDCLVFFFEAKTGIKTKSIAYHRDRPDVALITMESTLDVEQLMLDCKTETIDGATLRVSEVSVSNCIKVSNLPVDSTKDEIEQFFENAKRSKGGPVDKVTVIDDKSGLVFFKDYTVVSDILNQSHSLGNNTLHVGLFLECLKLTEEDAFRTETPQPVIVTHLDIKKIKFISQADEFRHGVEQLLHTQNANVEWPEEGSEDHGVKINYTSHATASRSNKSTRRWQKEIKDTFENLMKRIHIHTIRLETGYHCDASSIECLAENDEYVMVCTDKDTSTVTIVGASEKLDTSIRSMYGISGDADVEFRKEIVLLTHDIELKMLESMKFEDKIKEFVPNAVVKTTKQDLTVAFEGDIIDVRSAKLLLFEIKNEFVTVLTDTLSPLVVQLYSKIQTTEFINDKLKSSNLQCFWKMIDQKIAICCKKQYEIDRCIQVIKSSVVENIIHLRENEADDCNFDILMRKLVVLQRIYPEKVATSLHKNCRLYVCSTDDISQRLLADVMESIQKSLQPKQFRLKKEDLSSSEEFERGDTDLKAGNVKIELSYENIAEQKVDGILCSTSQNMDLSLNGSCKALLKAGGYTLQEECKLKYKNKLEDGKVAEIEGGKLFCKYVFLTVLPRFDDEAIGILKRAIQTLLQRAQTKRMKSLALPALGTGYRQYPNDDVCKCMFRTVIEWAQRNPNSSLQNVRFVMRAKDHDVIQTFRSYMLSARRGNREGRRSTVDSKQYGTLPKTAPAIRRSRSAFYGYSRKHSDPTN